MKPRFRITNDADLRSRMNLSGISGGYDNADTMHNVYLDFGYPDSLSFSNFWNMYRRFGIAKNIIDLPVDAAWMTAPVVEGKNELFNKQLEELVKRLKLWHRVKGLDTRQRVGRYAGMFMRIKDGEMPDKPIKGKLAGPSNLVEMIPLYENQLKVLETNNDLTSVDYGKPKMYQFSSGAVGNRNENAQDSFSIHPSRLIMAAEGADDGSIYGVPILEAAYNSLMDLRKIIGAGGEGFYKNASQTIVFELKDLASANVNKELLDSFNEIYDDFQKDRSRRGLWTPGLDPKVLQSNMINPEQFFMSALNDVAAAVNIPSTILIGQQTGRLASNEDSRSFLSMVNSRRSNFISELVSDVIDWFIQYGVLPNSDYGVYWDDLMALSKTEKLDNARKMADINRENYQSGGQMVFAEEEIRVQAGFKGDEVPEVEDLLDDEMVDLENEPMDDDDGSEDEI